MVVLVRTRDLHGRQRVRVPRELGLAVVVVEHEVGVLRVARLPRVGRRVAEDALPADVLEVDVRLVVAAEVAVRVGRAPCKIDVLDLVDVLHHAVHGLHVVGHAVSVAVG